MVEKYNKVYLLVHPFYELFFTPDFFKYEDHKEYADSIKSKIRSKEKFTTNYLKKTKGIYGNLIKNIAKEKNSILIIVQPPELIEFPDLHVPASLFDKYLVLKEKYHELLNFQKNILNDFYSFANDLLGKRLIVSNYGIQKKFRVDNSYGVLVPKFMNKEFITKLDKNIELISMGEFYNQKGCKAGCVSNWAGVTRNLLAEKGIIAEVNIFKEKTLGFEAEGLSGFRKPILPSHERRQVHQREKNKKSRQNRSIKKQIRPL